jgi:hypothetical protein
MAKYNKPQTKEVEKAMLMITATKDCGVFEARREWDMLIEVLGNPEHHGHVQRISLRQSWKNVESWQSDMSSHHMRQAYKEGLI